MHGKPCQVCGIGAMLVAKAIRVDALRIDEKFNKDPQKSTHRYLRGAFTAQQLNQIEKQAAGGLLAMNFILG